MANLPFSANPQRFDPYKNFRFVVKFDKKTPVAGLSKCTGLKKTTEMIEWREAGNSNVVRKLPGRTSYQPITCEMGVTHSSEFEDWANLVNKYVGIKASEKEMSLAQYRKDIRLELLNEQGNPVIAYIIHRAWVSEYQALPDLDAGAHAVAITSIKIEHEGFERDDGTKEPKES